MFILIVEDASIAKIFIADGCFFKIRARLIVNDVKNELSESIEIKKGLFRGFST